MDSNGKQGEPISMIIRCSHSHERQMGTLMSAGGCCYEFLVRLMHSNHSPAKYCSRNHRLQRALMARLSCRVMTKARSEPRNTEVHKHRLLEQWVLNNVDSSMVAVRPRYRRLDLSMSDLGALADRSVVGER